MSLANWTTRLLVAGAQRDAQQAPAPDSRPDDAPLLAASSSGAPTFVGSRIGPYLVTKRIGVGGVGEVYKGVDTMLKRDVAIKVMRDELAADPSFLARFRNEAQLQAKLSHPNIASVYAFLQEGDKQLMVMEYVAGISLDEFVRAGGPVPVERALNIFRRALDGIAHAHGHGIVHRDIKPANIMLADSGQVKVMDFGIARALDSLEHLTRVGHVAGTAKAMSPEQIRGKQSDVRSDIYSLGIVLYTLLAGRAPFDSDDDLELMKAQLEQTPPPLRGLVDKLSAKIEAAVNRALEKDPAARFQTVGEFARAIDACIAELATKAPPSAAPLRTDAPTVSRTAINPALQGVKRLPAVSAKRAGPKARGGATPGLRMGALALGVLALAGGSVLTWQAFRPTGGSSFAAPRPVMAGAPPQRVAESPSIEPPATTPVTHDLPSSPPQVLAKATVPTLEPASAAQAVSPAQPLLPRAQPSTSQSLRLAPVQLPTLAIAAVTASGAVVAAAADTSYRFQSGERIRLLVTPSQDAHIYCYLQDETRRIQRFFPNRFNRNALVKAGEPLQIPGGMRFELVANSLKATEAVACFASNRDVSADLPAAVFGRDFTRLGAASLDEIREAFARAAALGLAEARFQIDAE